MFFGCCGTRFAQTSSHLIQKTSTILLIFIRRTNEQPYDFMKKWACFSIFEVKVAILAPSIALFGIILFLSNTNSFLFYDKRFYYYTLQRGEELKKSQDIRAIENRPYS